MACEFVHVFLFRFYLTAICYLWGVRFLFMLSILLLNMDFIIYLTHNYPSLLCSYIHVRQWSGLNWPFR